MKLLEQLRREQAQQKKILIQPSAGPVDAGPVSEAVRRGIETLYSDLDGLAEGLNQLETDVRVDYAIDSVGALRGLRQGSYAVLDEETKTPRFVFAFECVGARPLTRLVPTVTERERIQAQLDSFGLGFSVDGKSAIHYAIVVKPSVPVRLEFAPTADGQEIRVTAQNLTRLGRELYSIHPDEVSEELVDELGKLILRRDNRFAELTGNSISPEARERLRTQLRLEGRSGEAAASSTARTNRGSSAGGDTLHRAPRRAPIMVADDMPSDGWVTWDADPPAQHTLAVNSTGGEASGSPAGSTPGGRDQGDPVPASYAWVITNDADNADPDESIAKRGPPGTSRAFPTPMIVETGEDFRLMDADGEMRYNGMILGKYRGTEPLVEFGRQHECNDIEYLRDGTWVRLGAAG